MRVTDRWEPGLPSGWFALYSPLPWHFGSTKETFSCRRPLLLGQFSTYGTVGIFQDDQIWKTQTMPHLLQHLAIPTTRQLHQLVAPLSILKVSRIRICTQGSRFSPFPVDLIVFTVGSRFSRLWLL